MLKLKANPTFTAEVTVTVQGGEKHVLDIKFKHMRKEAADEHFKVVAGVELASKLAKVIESWEGVEFPCTEEGLKEMDQEYPSALHQLVSAYIDQLAFGRSGN